MILALIALACGIAPAWGATAVMVQDFEKVTPPPTVWVVNIPNENASVQLSTDQPHDGKQCLKLHYHFVGAGNFQYLTIPNKVKIQAPVHNLHFWLKGDNSKCSYGLQVSDASGETHQYRSLSTGQGQGGIIDFTGWKEVSFDLVAPHETWGGDKNGKIDYLITAIIFTLGQPMDNGKLLPVESDLFFDSLSVDSEKSAEETLGVQVAVVSPEYGSDVKGDTVVSFAGPGFKSVTVKCWKQGDGFGSDSIVGTVALDAQGHGHPNAFDTYMICPHAWEQGESGKAIEKKAFEALHNPIRMHKFGIPSAWYETFHLYGCKITDTDTIYYCDNIEVGRHPTLPLSKEKPFFFLINLATGGGWPVDLSRYDGLADMYVDYVRVYQGKE
jgi:hypothetical protein